MRKRDADASTLVLLGFDMETDIGSWTPFYNGLVRGTPRILKILDKKKVTSTFYFTGDAVKEHPKVARMVRDAGHEVGAHSLHHETMGDEIFPIPGVRPLLPSEIPNRLQVSQRIITRAIGRRPVSFRAPRLWGSTALVRALDDMGYIADATYPMFHFEEQLAPYHPSKRDWTKSGRMKILEIPNVADMGMRSCDPYGRDRDLWAFHRTHGAETVIKRLESFANVVAEKWLPLVISLYFHPWEFAVMPKPPIHYGEAAIILDEFIVKNCGAESLRQLGRLIDQLRKRFNARFLSAEQLAHEWHQKPLPPRPLNLRNKPSFCERPSQDKLSPRHEPLRTRDLGGHSVGTTEGIRFEGSSIEDAGGLKAMNSIRDRSMGRTAGKSFLHR